MKCLLKVFCMLSFFTAPLAQAQGWQTSIDQDLFVLYDGLKNTLQTPQEFADRNQKLLQSALQEPMTQRFERRQAVTEMEAQEILDEMMRHPVVGLEIEKKYDPQMRFGFCFGRAAWAHIELLRRGILKDSIKKIFVVGPMASDGLMWQFHVATMVRLTNGDWITIDSDLKKTLRVADWIQEVNRMSTNGKLAYFITEPTRFGASTTTKVGPQMFRNPLNDKMYNQYFEDMMAAFRQVSKVKSAAAPLCASVFTSPSLER